jgi:hypothetical protein
MIFDQKRLVRVSNKAETQGGTGFLLSPHRVLTARHVLRDLQNPYVTFNDAFRKRVQVPSKEVLWQGEGPLDIAILRIETDLAIGHQRLDGRVLASDEPWRSRGWAVGGAALPHSDLILSSMSPLSGLAYAFEEGEESLQLTLEAAGSSVKLWKGASGAPIFCGKRLVGVIRGGPSAFKGERLYATPIAAVWEQDGFQKSVDYGGSEGEVREARRADLIQDLARLLRESKEAARHIAAEHPSWWEVFEHRERGDRDLAEALCTELPWREALQAFDRAHNKVLKDKEGDWRKTATVIVAILERALPEIYGSTDLGIVQGFDGGQLVDLPIETVTLAELAMAALDGRPASFEQVTKERQYPAGTALIPVSLESSGTVQEGFDFAMEGAFDSWLRLLAYWLEIDVRLLQTLLDQERFEELARIVNRELEREVERGRSPRRYFVYPPSFVSDYGPFLDLVRSRLPALHLVEMSGHSLADEHEDCEPLQNILFQTHVARKPEP